MRAAWTGTKLKLAEYPSIISAAWNRATMSELTMCAVPQWPKGALLLGWRAERTQDGGAHRGDEVFELLPTPVLEDMGG